MPTLLRAEHIDKRFGGVHALDDVTIDVQAGEVLALVGENGAGKSTLGKVIAGAVTPDAGAVFLDGKPVPMTSPMAAQRCGIGIIYQELDLFPNLTVAENIAIGNLRVEARAVVSFKRLDRLVAPFLEQVDLKVSPRTVLRDLPIGQRQLVAIARALSMNARLIVMDEATSSLTDDAVDNLFRIISRLKASGVAIVYVSHKMDEIFRVSDRIAVLRDGRFVGESKTGETNAAEIIRMMVGREFTPSVGDHSSRTDRVVLSVNVLTTAKLTDICFDLHAGEVLGVAGLVGAGRSELGAALFGLDRVTSGSIMKDGRPIAPRCPRDAIREAIGLVPEDRKLQGLMMQMSVRENTSLSAITQLASVGVIRSRGEADATDAVQHNVALKAPSPHAPVSTLSGGNQQKVLLARWLMVDPDVLFLDDPTRGVDVGAKEDIYALIEGLADAGKGVIFVSSELPELLRCCDRIMVLHEGRNMGIVDAGTATQEQIMALATRTVAA
jgi:ribose transport system ATP-binding protein